MSENTPNRISKPLSTAEKLKVGAAATGLAITGIATSVLGINAVVNPDQGTNDQSGNVTVQFDKDGTAWDTAADIKDTDADQKDLAGMIKEQTDKQGYPGVQAGETAVLPADDVSKEALEKYQVGMAPLSKDPSHEAAAENGGHSEESGYGTEIATPPQAPMQPLTTEPPVPLQRD